jgi:tetratricopeptide (TPR) repeat protein
VGRDLAFEARIQNDPSGAIRELNEALAGIRDREHPELVRLLAMAYQRAGDRVASLRTSRRAVRVARAADDRQGVGRALATHANALALNGRMAEAAASADEALRLVGPEDRGVALLYRGIVHWRAGEPLAAIRSNAAAERAFRRAGQLTDAAGARLNVALLRATNGDPRGALADLELVDRAIADGAALPRWIVDTNRAHALVQVGDYAQALDAFDAALVTLRRAGIPTRPLELDYLEALAGAGLALTVLQRATALLQQHGLSARERATIELLAADAHRGQGDWPAALPLARRARRRLLRVGDDPAAARATVVAAELTCLTVNRRQARTALRAAVTTAEEINDRPLQTRAEAALSRIDGTRPPSLGRASKDPAAEVAVLLARAEAAVTRNRRTGLLQVLERLVAHRHALRERSATLRSPAVATTGTADLIAIAVRGAVRTGDARYLAAVVARVRALMLPLGHRLPVPEPGGRHLDFLTLGPDVIGVTTFECAARALRLGTIAEVTRLTRFARLDRARVSHSDRTGSGNATASLGDLLFAGAELGDHGARLQLTAAPRLAFVPWAALTALHEHTWSLVVAAGMGDPAGAAPGDATTVIVGPDLPNGASEARRIAAHYASPTVLQDAAATPARALGALGGRGIVHIAAHAGRRGDDPLLSWIELAGGALSNAALVSEPVRASCVVLSACEAAAAAGDVSAGIVTPAAIIVRRGATAVIAATDPVDHRDAEELMDELHGLLSQGLPAPVALARARAAQAANPAASTFLCLTAAP